MKKQVEKVKIDIGTESKREKEIENITKLSRKNMIIKIETERNQTEHFFVIVFH